MTTVAADPAAHLSIRADAGEVRPASVWLEQACLARDVPAEPRHRLDLCLNEVLANILAHGGPSALSAPIEMYFHIRQTPDFSEVAVTVTDTGVAFNPLDIEPNIQPATLAETNIGGLGLPMLRSFTEALSYCHDEGRNQLTFTVRW